MKRTLFLALTLLSLAILPLAAQDKQKAKGKQADDPIAAAAAKVRDNPDDADALTSYINESLLASIQGMDKDPKATLKGIDELDGYMDKVQSSNQGVRSALSRGRALTKAYRKRAELMAAPLQELQNRLKANPGDSSALENYFQKIVMEISPLTRSEPEAAAEKLASARAFLASVKESPTGEALSLLRRADQGLDELEQMIEAGRKLNALVGKPAAPLKVESWVNGSPLTDNDLKGKVVLLDFWAVWCGPCIAGFPHLREWQQEYADKGLIIIGVTQYYNFAWDADAKSPSRSQGPVTHAEEREMLEKFAEQHELKHRFAVTADDTLSEFYAVSGIPHVVLIDRQGIVRLMRVGTSEENTKAIDEMLGKLIAEKPGAGK